jgi:hypothetical protein
MLRTYFYYLLLLPLSIRAQTSLYLKPMLASDEVDRHPECGLDNPACYRSNTLCSTTEHEFLDKRSYPRTNLAGGANEDPVTTVVTVVTIPTFTQRLTLPQVTTTVVTNTTMLHSNTPPTSITPTLVGQTLVLSTYISTSTSLVAELTTILLTPSSTIPSPAPPTSTTSLNASGQTATISTQVQPASTASHGGVGRIVRDEKLYALGLMIAVGILV